MKKNLFIHAFFIFSIVFISNTSTLIAMKSKNQQQTVVFHQKTPLDLPDELLTEIILFMLGDDHGKTILTMCLVCPRTYAIIMNKIYAQFFPGLHDPFTPEAKQINLSQKRKIPRISFYVIIKFIETMKNDTIDERFLTLLTNKKYLTFECIVPAYKLAKEDTRLKRFLYQQIDNLFEKCNNDIDKDKAELQKNETMSEKYADRACAIHSLLMSYWHRRTKFLKKASVNIEKLTEIVHKSTKLKLLMERFLIASGRAGIGDIIE